MRARRIEGFDVDFIGTRNGILQSGGRNSGNARYRCRFYFLEWYDYVYEDKYEDVDSAIIAATDANEENIYKILENTEKLNALYKDIRDGDLKEEVKAVMQAYNEYYSFVIEVSGSFNDFSANKENLKKALSTAIKNLFIEL